MDYLKQEDEFDEHELYIDYMLGIKEFIFRKLSTYKDDEKIYKKYVWLKNIIIKQLRLSLLNLNNCLFLK